LQLNNIKNRQWAIFKTCAKSGKGLDDAFKWLSNLMRNKN
jgi:ADP-ribosylation factor-like protein 1